MILSTGRLPCPRYAATFKVGLASGHQGCFGRVSPLSLMPTVVTRPEPHNLCIVHPTQDRVLTPRCDPCIDLGVALASLVLCRWNSWTCRLF